MKTLSKNKKICKFIWKIAFYIILTIGVNQILAYLLSYDMDPYTRLTFHEMYTQEDNIDVLLLGSSHCNRSLIPDILDDTFGKNTFNAGTSFQELDGSYTILKEVGKNNHIEEVYLEVFFYLANLPLYKDRTELYSTYIISDYLKPSMNKFQYLLEASNGTHYVNSFLLPRRYMNQDISMEKRISNIKTKISNSYRNYEYVENENGSYEGKGFLAYPVDIPEGILYKHKEYSKIPDNIFNDDYKKSLFQIIDYCKENDIKLTLYSAPMPDFRLENIEYDKYIIQVDKLLQGTSIPYVDFNLCKENVLTFDKNIDYADENHLSALGAEKFTKFFGKLFANEVVLERESSNLYLPEEYFYSTYNEKYENLSDDLLGVIITKNENEYNIRSVIAGVIDVTYEIILENEHFAVKNNKFIIPENHEGEVELGIMMTGKEKKVISIESIIL